jgi:hypothetical protein
MCLCLGLVGCLLLVDDISQNLFVLDVHFLLSNDVPYDSQDPVVFSLFTRDKKRGTCTLRLLHRPRSPPDLEEQT